MNRYVSKHVSMISRLLLCLAGSILFSAYAAAQNSGTPPASAQGPGAALIFIVSDPGLLNVTIEAPLANYGVAPNDDYDTMRDAVSAAINSEIEDVELSTGSKIVPNEEAVCRNDGGNESIFERNGQWIVVLGVDFECEQESKLTHIHFNIFDVPGFTTATARLISGDREAEFPLDGANRKLDLR